MGRLEKGCSHLSPELSWATREEASNTNGQCAIKEPNTHCWHYSDRAQPELLPIHVLVDMHERCIFELENGESDFRGRILKATVIESRPISSV
jgi:hypothetical protein